MRNILFLILFLTIAFSRENPFEPADSSYPKIEPISKVMSQKRVDPSRSKKIFKWFSIEILDDSIYLKTKDSLFRDFTIDDPKKIVIDFKPKRAFKTKSIKIDTNRCISKITFGSHKSYYRLALVMRDKCLYELLKIDGGYKLQFK